MSASCIYQKGYINWKRKKMKIFYFCIKKIMPFFYLVISLIFIITNFYVKITFKSFFSICIFRNHSFQLFLYFFSFLNLQKLLKWTDAHTHTPFCMHKHEWTHADKWSLLLQKNTRVNYGIWSVTTWNADQRVNREIRGFNVNLPNQVY